jgi:hypothetical protein
VHVFLFYCRFRTMSSPASSSSSHRQLVLVLGMAFVTAAYAAGAKAGARSETSSAPARDRARLIQLMLDHPEMRLVTLNNNQTAADCAPQRHLAAYFDRKAVPELKKMVAGAPFKFIFADYFRFPVDYMRSAYGPFTRSLLPALIENGLMDEHTALIMPNLPGLFAGMAGHAYERPTPEAPPCYLCFEPLQPNDYALYVATNHLAADLLDGYTNEGQLRSLLSCSPFVSITLTLSSKESQVSFQKVCVVANQGVNVSAAAASSSNPAHTHMVMVHDTFREPWYVDIDNRPAQGQYQSGVWNLLSDNGCLGPMLSRFSQPVMDGSVLRVGEVSLLNLHIIRHLHELQLRSPTPNQLRISFVNLSLFKTSLLSPNELYNALGPPPSWTPLVFRSTKNNVQASESSIAVCWCPTLEDAMAVDTKGNGRPINVVFLPSLTWFMEQADDAQRRQCIERLLQKVHEAQRARYGAAIRPPALYPPVSWDAKIEHKDRVYEEFKDFMIPTRWELLHSIDGGYGEASIRNVCERILREQPNGVYYVKGKHCSVQFNLTALYSIAHASP